MRWIQCRMLRKQAPVWSYWRRIPACISSSLPAALLCAKDKQHEENNLQTLVMISFIVTSFMGTSPEKYFDVAVLNSNFLSGFENERHIRELESPSMKLSDDELAVAMKRVEVIELKIAFVEKTVEKLKNLKHTTDNVDIIHSSLELYEYVLPVYKNEYLQLANLYDHEASENITHQYAEAIMDKYSFKYEELYDRLITLGKVYAQEHHIKVEWPM